MSNFGRKYVKNHNKRQKKYHDNFISNFSRPFLKDNNVKQKPPKEKLSGGELLLLIYAIISLIWLTIGLICNNLVFYRSSEFTIHFHGASAVCLYIGYLLFMLSIILTIINYKSKIIDVKILILFGVTFTIFGALIGVFQ